MRRRDMMLPSAQSGPFTLTLEEATGAITLLSLGQAMAGSTNIYMRCTSEIGSADEGIFSLVHIQSTHGDVTAVLEQMYRRTIAGAIGTGTLTNNVKAAAGSTFAVYALSVT